jgi:hypothetical protein
MKPLTIKSDYWQTGSDLMNDKSGIFHVSLGNQRERLIAERDQPTSPAPRVAERAPPRPAAPAPEGPKTALPEPAVQPMAISWETKACLELNTVQKIYVNVPCKP